MAILVLATGVPAASGAGYITVGLAPVAHFDSNYAFGSAPITVTFTDYSTGTQPLTYLWDFGDGETSSLASPVHTYIRQGSYNVSLTVTNAYGSSTETKPNHVIVGLGPRADFTASPTTGSTPLGVLFTDRSTGNPTAWSWHFGDGGTSTEQHPFHTYRSAGDFTVSLRVSNGYGQSETVKGYLIHLKPALKSKFIAEPRTGNVPLLVKFTDKSEGEPESWHWNFGDGTTSSEPSPVHMYATPGSYDVNLTITRGFDKDSSYGTIVTGGVPGADFSADATTVGVGVPVRFTDRSLYSPESWSWDFGDGSVTTEQNPAHAYLLKGIYTVILTAKNRNGEDVEKKVDYITVGVVPVADFIIDIPSYQQGTRVQYARFTDTSRGNPTSWYWDFGDGSTSTERSPPLHLYNKDGTYTVTLTVKNSFGEDTEVEYNAITVREGPSVDFTADKTFVSVGRFVRFTDLSSIRPTSWSWNFGDGQFDSSQNPYHIYRKEGNYSVSLTVSDGITSISHRKVNYIRVVDLPDADFRADRTKGVTPFTVNFTDISGGNPSQWSWEFGDGTTSTDQNPVHTYTTQGNTSINTYTVTLTAGNRNGADTEQKVSYITVTQGPVAEFTVDERSGKAPFIVKFRDLSMGNPTAWKWEFGDGTVSTEQHPVHQYPYEGAYDVRLTVSNQFGTDSIFKTGTSSQRAGAEPVPLANGAATVPVTPAGSQPVAGATAGETTPAPAASAPAPAPVPLFIPVCGVILGFLIAVLQKPR